MREAGDLAVGDVGGEGGGSGRPLTRKVSMVCMHFRSGSSWRGIGDFQSRRGGAGGLRAIGRRGGLFRGG